MGAPEPATTPHQETLLWSIESITQRSLTENILCVYSSGWIYEGERIVHMGCMRGGYTCRQIRRSEVISISRRQGTIWLTDGPHSFYASEKWSQSGYADHGKSWLVDNTGLKFGELPPGEALRQLSESWLREPCRFMVKSFSRAYRKNAVGLEVNHVYTGTNLDMLTAEAHSCVTWRIPPDQVRNEVNGVATLYYRGEYLGGFKVAEALPEQLKIVSEHQLQVLLTTGDPRW